MAFVTKQKDNLKFQNYISAVLALNKAGECLEPFTENGIQGVFDTIKGMLGHLPECTKQCSGQIRTVENWCYTCKQWKQKLITYHNNNTFVKWDPLHSWLWPKDANKIFEVFANVRTIQPNLKDISTIFCVWKNCSEFDDLHVLAMKLRGLKDMRDNLFHNECETTTEALTKILNDIRQLIGDQDIKDTMDNYAEVKTTLDELEKQNVWFDESLLIQSIEELMENQNEKNQARITNLVDRVPQLLKANNHSIKELFDNQNKKFQELFDNQNKKTQEEKQNIADSFQPFLEANSRSFTEKVFRGFRKYKNCVIWIVFGMLALVFSYMLPNDSSLGIQRYGCLDEHPKNAVLQANFSMEGYLTPYNELLGRTWLFQEVEEQLLRLDTPSHGLVLIAEMGYGKTAFMRNVICAEENKSGTLLREHVAAYHVCRFQSKRTRNVGLFILRITSMISINLRNFSKFIDTDKTCTNNYGTIDECEADMFGCFDQCVMFPLRQEPHGILNPPLIIVIDAIDECTEETTGTNSILKLLNQRIHNLPRWIQFLISSRNISLIHSLDQTLRIQTLVSHDSRNIQDINLYLKYHNVSDTKLHESTMNFQILEFIFEQSDYTIFSTSSSPEVSLYRYYELNFNRLFENNYEIGKYILNIICASDEPLEESILIDIVGKINVNVREKNIEKNMSKLRHFISIINGKNQLIHNSLRRWLEYEQSIYRINLRKGHQDIAAYFIGHLPHSSYDTVDLLIHICKAAYPPVIVEGFRNLNTTELLISESYQYLSIYHRLALKINDGRTVHLAHHHFKSFEHKKRHRVSASYIAAFHGNDKVLDALVTIGFDINFRIDLPNMINIDDAIEMIESLHWNYGLLDIAAQYGRTRVVKYLLQNDSYQFDKRNGAHLLPIHLACKYGYLEIISMMHTQFSWMLDHTCLYFSAHHGFRDIIQYCLDHDINDDCMPCNTSLYWLSKNQVRMQGNVASLWSELVIYDDWHYINCETALHAAVVRNHSDIVHMLVQRTPFTIGCFDRSGKTPFMHTIIHDYRHIGSLMMESKCFNPSVTCKPVMLYENYSQLSGHELNKLNTNRCPEDTSLIHLSAQFDRTWFIERIFAKMGYYSEKRDEYGCHPLHYAACRGSLHILRHFVKLNSTNITELSCSNGSLLMHSAAICGSVESVKFLRTYFRTNVVDKAGRTTLMYTVLRYVGHDTAFDAESTLRNTSKIMDALHINENDLKVHDEYQRNIFHYAIAHGHFVVMTVMIERYPDLVRVLLRNKDAFGLNPVSYAITQMTRDNTFRLNVTDLTEFECREHRQKTLMSPTEYSIFLLFLRHSQGLGYVKLNNRRVLDKFIEKNSFQLFSVTLKCIQSDLSREDDERVLNKLVQYDASGLMMFVYARMRWFIQSKLKLRTGQYDLTKCATWFEFSITHFLALHIDNIIQVKILHENAFKRFIYTQILQMYFESIDANRFNTCYDSDGYNVLERAIQGGNVKFVKFLIRNGFKTARDTCELLHMTVTPYKFRNSSDLQWTITISIHHEFEFFVFKTSSGDVFINLSSWFLPYNISNSFDNMKCDDMGKYLLDFYHDNLSERCICSNGSLQLSFVHYLAMGNYKLSTDTAVKYFGTSILMCINRHLLTPLYFAKFFNSTELINYLEYQNIKLQLPTLEAEQNLFITMQTKHDSIRTLYRKCFSFRLDNVLISGIFRRNMIMIRCVRKLSKRFGLNNENLMAELSRLKAKSIMDNNYNFLRKLDAKELKNNYRFKDKMAHDVFERQTYKVFWNAIMRTVKFELQHNSVIRLRSFKLITYSNLKLLENVPFDFIVLYKSTILHSMEYKMKTNRLSADIMKSTILWIQTNPKDLPCMYRFYYDRFKTVFCTTCRFRSISNIFPHYVFTNIRYTTLYRNSFIPKYASIDAVNKAMYTFVGIYSRILKETKLNLG